MSTKKRDFLYPIAGLVITLLFALALKISAFSEGSLIGITDGLETQSFWLIFLIYFGIASLIVYLILFKTKWLHVQTNPNSKEEKTRRVSDDALIIFFFIGFIVYGLPVSLRSDNDLIASYFDKYIYFIIISISYVFFLKLSQIIKAIQHKQKLTLFELGNVDDYENILSISLLFFLIALILSYFIPLFIPAEGFFSKDGREYLLFMLLGSIPSEELVFRGLASLLFGRVFYEFICDFKNIPEENRNPNDIYSKWAWYLGILISSGLFGIYHISRYGLDLSAIIYLTTLGFLLGMVNYKMGLLACYLLHALNNIGANVTASILQQLIIEPLFYLGLGLVIIGVILLNKFFSKKVIKE